MSYIPLNGPEPIRAVERALTGAGFTRTEPVVPLLRQVVEPTGPKQATTKEATGDTGARDLAVDPADDQESVGNQPKPPRGDKLPEGRESRRVFPPAIDPTQGHGGHHRPDPDPLVAALRQLPSMTGYF